MQYHFSKTFIKTPRFCINGHEYFSICCSQAVDLDCCQKEYISTSIICINLNTLIYTRKNRQKKWIAKMSKSSFKFELE